MLLQAHRQLSHLPARLQPSPFPLQTYFQHHPQPCRLFLTPKLVPLHVHTALLHTTTHTQPGKPLSITSSRPLLYSPHPKPKHHIPMASGHLQAR